MVLTAIFKVQQYSYDIYPWWQINTNICVFLLVYHGSLMECVVGICMGFQIPGWLFEEAASEYWNPLDIHYSIISYVNTTYFDGQCSPAIVSKK